jgi:hypothetical protein
VETACRLAPAAGLPNLAGMTELAEVNAPNFLTPRDVCALLHIARSTLPAWRSAGLLEGHQLPNGEWRYRDDHPTIVNARAALTKPLRDALPVGQLTLDGDA